MCIRDSLADGLDGADFVVGGHDGNQGRIRPQRFFQRFQADDAVLIHRQIGDFKALFFQLLRRVQNGVMLTLRGDDVTAARLLRVGRAAQRPVVGLRAAAREIDFARLRAQRRRHLPAGLLLSLIHISCPARKDRVPAPADRR